jgi:octaprenyl-diphosphate synthase
LFGGSAEIGGLLGKVTAERQQALREYGFNLGVAFQIVDDLLDFTGDAASVGKPIGSDLREGKVTLPLIHMLRHADARAGAIVRDVITSRNVTPEVWQEILAYLKQHASIDYANRRAEEYAERAKAPLYAFPASAERDALLALPDYVLSRDR